MLYRGGLVGNNCSLVVGLEETSWHEDTDSPGPDVKLEWIRSDIRQYQYVRAARHRQERVGIAISRRTNVS